jgi:hypothetical protein
MSRNKAVLLVVCAVDLRVPAVLFGFHELVEPVLQVFLGCEGEVELHEEKRRSVSHHQPTASNKKRKKKTHLGAKVHPIVIIPLPVRPVVQHVTAALLAVRLELVLGHVPVVAEQVVRVHLVVDLVGAGGLGAQGLPGLVDGVEIGVGLVLEGRDHGRHFLEGVLEFEELLVIRGKLDLGVGAVRGGRCEGAG